MWRFIQLLLQAWEIRKCSTKSTSNLDICLMHCVSFKRAQFGLLPHFHLALVFTLSRLHTQSRVTTLMCVSRSTYVRHTCIHSHFLIYRTFMSKQDKLIHANTHTCTNTHAMTKPVQSQLVAPDAHTTCREIHFLTCIDMEVMRRLDSCRRHSCPAWADFRDRRIFFYACS